MLNLITLLAFLETENKNDSHRLSFDTTDSGVYIIDFTFSDQVYFLGLMFKDQLNPGQIKARLRKITYGIEQIEQSSFQDETQKIEHHPLFDNITDEEIERMFSAAGI